MPGAARAYSPQQPPPFRTAPTRTCGFITRSFPMSLKKIVYASAIALALTASNAHAFASDCGDSLWKFSAIEALTCVFSGQW
ncbi:conserved hypothetical protein [Pseudomonas protegens Pf-5]|uniref:Uncharacterized protein n=4 Tax=Pseudomonas TaxID=286 RepID=Q4KD04_PSEF5|nr:conserved hypothetical protein [Pseudomonas protegens Pf-5]